VPPRASDHERRRVAELIAGRLLGTMECVSVPTSALSEAIERGSLSWDEPWLCAEGAQFDETVKDCVRRRLGLVTSADRREVREAERLRFRRSLERKRLRLDSCRDAPGWEVAAGWELTGVNGAYVRSMLSAIVAGRSRRAGGVVQRPSRSRRPGVRACRRGTRSTRAGPGDSEGEPDLASRHTAALWRWAL
jgi:hypothetical protein